jgi:hypothetical protein
MAQALQSCCASQEKWVSFMGLQVSEVAEVNDGGHGSMLVSVCVHGKDGKNGRVNPHNDGFPPIKLHVPRLTHGSLGSSFLSTWSLFLSPKELRITRVISPNLSLLGKYIIIFPWQ